MARLRQAKEEAEREIADFRAQMEADFQRRLTEVRFRLNYRFHKIIGGSTETIPQQQLLFPSSFVISYTSVLKFEKSGLLKSRGFSCEGRGNVKRLGS